MPPRGIVQAMELQAEAERRKRAAVLESEGQRQAKINVAEADKQQVRACLGGGILCKCVGGVAAPGGRL
jgi:regulator of protease activity HflC (stomatin/prohibitin superfamily)